MVMIFLKKYSKATGLSGVLVFFMHVFPPEVKEGIE